MQGEEMVAAEKSLDLKAGLILVMLCALWGLNAVAIKLSNTGISPIFTAGLRSVIASVCLIIWMKKQGMRLFPGKVSNGMVIGLLFGLEFGVLYSALLYTKVASAWILLYSTPFFHALGAHVFLRGDRLSSGKSFGLTVAFIGVFILLSKHVEIPSRPELLGDLLAVGAAILWAATTIYIKRTLVGRVSPYHTLFYQTLFSIPVLFALSAFFEEAAFRQISIPVFVSLSFQGIVIAFLSYLLWFSLVHTYAVSRLSAFTFLTPVFAAGAGVLFLQEAITLRIVTALVLVSLGIYWVNRT